MKNNIKIAVLVMLILFTISNIIFAANISLIDTNKKGSLEITKYEHINGDTSQNIQFKGVEFTLYKVTDDVKNIGQAKDYISANTNIEKYIKETDNNGKVKFENLSLGRYYVVESNSPINVLEPVTPFLVNIPMTSDSGNNWVYDVKVYPKNVTVYGNVKFNILDEYENPLNGIKYKLQQKEGEIWKDNQYATDLISKDGGKILLNNLPAGEYKLVPTETKEGYILDKSDVKPFTIDLDNLNIDIQATIRKPEIKMEVLLSNGEYRKK